MISSVLPPEAKSRLGGAAVGSMILKTSYLLFTVAITIALARMMGPARYGIYALFYSLIMILAIPAQAGLPTLIIREIAGFELEEKWGLLRGLLRRANQAVAVLSVTIAAIAALIMASDYLSLSGQERDTLIYALILLPLIALGNLRGAALRGLRRVLRGQIPEQVLTPGLFLISIGVAAALLGEMTPSLAMALHALAAFVAFLVGAVLLWRALPNPTKVADPEYRTVSWLVDLLPLSLISGIGVINSRMDIVLLGVLGSSADVGIYRVAAQASNLVVFTLAAVNFVLGPYVARHYANGDKESLQNLVAWGARVALITSLPVALVLMVAGRSLLSAIFGEAYVPGTTALIILCIGQLCNVAAGSVALILNMTGFERETMIGVSSAAAANVVLNLMLIPLWGMEGAAIATAASVALWNVILVSRVRQRIGISSVAWAVRNQ